MIIENEELLSLMPHRGRMLLLNRVTEYSLEKRKLAAEYTITEDCLFYDPLLGGVPGWVSFEFMAQSVSVMSGLSDRARGEEPGCGFILSVSAMKIHIPVINAGSTVQIRVAEDSRMDTIYVINGEVLEGDKKVIEGKLTVMSVDKKMMETLIRGGAVKETGIIG